MSSTTYTLEHVVKLVGDYNPDEIAYVRMLDDYLCIFSSALFLIFSVSMLTPL